MANLVFTHKASSLYDDSVHERYHFPKVYLKTALLGVGDYVVYYRPRRGGLPGYFATALLDAIDPDPMREGMYYARVSQFGEFLNFVSWKDERGHRESAGGKADGSGNRGFYNLSVRRIPLPEFLSILGQGLVGAATPPGVSEAAPASELREREQRLVSRTVRDRAFAGLVLPAYGHRCAVSGMRLVTPASTRGLQAAHIRPVGSGHNGPDAVPNGIALSPTYHWLFDAGLMRVDVSGARGRVLYSGDMVDEDRRRLVPDGSEFELPSDPASRPHDKFVEYHRRVVWEKWRRNGGEPPPRLAAS